MSFLPPLEMRPSSIAPKPVESRETPPNCSVSLTSQRHPETFLRSPAQVEGTKGFLPQPVKDLNSRNTTWFPPLRKMRPLPATASQGKSPVGP